MSGPTDRRAPPAPEKDGTVPEALRRAWDELPKREPPELVDRAVLNRARAAVEAPHSSRPWSFGWPHALTTAAVIVLAVTLIIPLRETGQPGSTPEPQPRLPEAEEATSALAEEFADEVRDSGEPARERARQEVAPRSLSSPPLEKATAAPAASADAEAGARANAEVDAAAEVAITPEPERRLQAIRTLVEAGELDAAREALAAFKRDFPEAELPPELAALLEAP
jgi:hypothetical protein